MCVRPPPVPRSARVERTVKAAASAAPRHSTMTTMSLDEGRLRSVSNASVSSSVWSPTSMVNNQETVSGRWVEDSVVRACAKCEKPFTLTNRRHHCRVCGDIFCHACSRNKMVLATNPGEIPRRQRVCDPCASHAHSSAILYDAESEGTNRDNSLFSTGLSATELLTGGSISEDMLRGSSEIHKHIHGHRHSAVHASGESSLIVMVASTIAFVATFYFLKDEVSLSNPAIYILLVGFVKNVVELAARLSLIKQGSRIAPSSIQPAPELQDPEKVFEDMDMGAAPETSSTASSSDPASAAKDPRYVSVTITPAQQQELLSNAHKALDTVYELATASTEGKEWTPEIPSIEGLDIDIHSRDGKPARIFKCHAEIPLSPDELFDELHGKFETSSTWNVTSAENNVVTQLDECTDIVHLVSAPALGGMITSRDFVNTRSWRKQDGGYLIASACAGKNVIKAQKGIVRGENGPTGFLILPHESSPFKSRLVWILNCDIKGYFPGSIIRKGSISEVSCFVRNLRRYLASNPGSNASMEGKTSDVQ